MTQAAKVAHLPKPLTRADFSLHGYSSPDGLQVPFLCQGYQQPFSSLSHLNCGRTMRRSSQRSTGLCRAPCLQTIPFQASDFIPQSKNRHDDDCMDGSGTAGTCCSGLSLLRTRRISTAPAVPIDADCSPGFGLIFIGSYSPRHQNYQRTTRPR